MRSRERDIEIFSKAARVRRGGSKSSDAGVEDATAFAGASRRNFLAAPNSSRRASKGEGNGSAHCQRTGLPAAYQASTNGAAIASIFARLIFIVGVRVSDSIDQGSAATTNSWSRSYSGT